MQNDPNTGREAVLLWATSSHPELPQPTRSHLSRPGATSADPEPPQPRQSYKYAFLLNKPSFSCRQIVNGDTVSAGVSMKLLTAQLAGMLSLTILTVGCDPGGPEDSTTTTTSDVHSGA